LGRWDLKGSTLTLTALETFVMGEPGRERRIRNPQPFPHQIIARSANAYSSRGPSGKIQNMVRCPPAG
jgi:hypothetical protein